MFTHSYNCHNPWPFCGSSLSLSGLSFQSYIFCKLNLEAIRVSMPSYNILKASWSRSNIASIGGLYILDILPFTYIYVFSATLQQHYTQILCLLLITKSAALVCSVSVCTWLSTTFQLLVTAHKITYMLPASSPHHEVVLVHVLLHRWHRAMVHHQQHSDRISSLL